MSEGIVGEMGSGGGDEMVDIVDYAFVQRAALAQSKDVVLYVTIDPGVIGSDY